MTQYRKKPILVDAYQLCSADDILWPDWLSEARQAGVVSIDLTTGDVEIRTLEGTMKASPGKFSTNARISLHGDWIIKGVQNELYPCKDTIFKATYEEIVDNTYLDDLEDEESNHGKDVPRSLLYSEVRRP